MSFRAIIDMDGTIADFTTDSNQAAMDLFGIEILEEDLRIPRTAKIIWEKMTPEQRSQYNHYEDIYQDICGPGFFLNLKPYSGAVEAVKRLANNGVDIIFATLVLNWNNCTADKDLWLKKYFDDIEYTQIMVDKPEAKSYIDADVIVDDDLKVMAKANNIIRIMVKQPWNDNYRQLRHLRLVNTMVEAAGIILRLKESYEVCSI